MLGAVAVPAIVMMLVAVVVPVAVTIVASYWRTWVHPWSSSSAVPSKVV
jgi:hypothetical protein